MYCSNCGAEIKENQKFCGKCGAPAEGYSEADMAESSTENAAENEAVPAENPGSDHGRRNRWIILAIVAAAAVIIGVCIFLFTSKSSPLRANIDLNAYTVVEFDGYDGYGTAAVSIDYSKIVNEYGEKVKVKTEGDSLEKILKNGISVYLNTTSGLSDGDEVTSGYTIDDTYLDEHLNCNFTCESQTYTVEGLKKVNAIDVFEGVELSCSGTAPDGKVSLSGDVLDSAYGVYEISQDSGLSNGDEVTVTYTVSDRMGFLNEQGGLPAETEKTFTVSGMDAYITDITALSDDQISELKTEAEKQAKSKAKSLKSSTITKYLLGKSSKDSTSLGKEYKLVNIYFLRKKQNGEGNEAAEDIKENAEEEKKGDTASSGTILNSSVYSEPVFLYSVTAKVKDSDGKETKSGKIYVAVSFPDLLLSGDKDLTGVSTTKKYSYASKDDAYKAWVTGNKDRFDGLVYDKNLKEAK